MNKNTMTRWLPTVLWATIIFSFSSIPNVHASRFSLVDFMIKKLAHLTEYAIFYMLLLRSTRKNWFLAMVLLILFALSDEWHQSFTPGREPTLRDVGFDTIGGFWGGYVVWKLSPKVRKKLPAWVAS